MSFERNDLEVVGDERGIVLSRLRAEEAIHLDADDLRWLTTAAIPAALAIPAPVEKPSDASATVDGQIEGQTSIDDFLTTS